MKATRLTRALARYSVTPILLSGAISIACGAQPSTTQSNVNAPETPDLSSIAASANGEAPVSPQLQAALDRVTKAKADLDNAHKRLNASKAILKAADAEFKAAKADQQALTLQSQAQALATASGMNDASAATATTPAPAQPATAAQPVANTQSDSTGQTFDFSGTSPTPGK